MRVTGSCISALLVVIAYLVFVHFAHRDVSN